MALLYLLAMIVTRTLSFKVLSIPENTIALLPDGQML
jgi:hypothetical protein